jgi:HlyD family secretion protein
MTRTLWFDPRGHAARFRLVGGWLLALLTATGCGSEKEKTAPSITKPPEMQVIYPEIRKLSRVVGQPSFVQAYERTSIYPKVTSFIEKWNVDIGDKVRKGDELAKLFIPELGEMHGTKSAEVVLDKAKVDLSLKRVKVAQADVKAAAARLVEAKRILAAYKAEVERWESEVNRLHTEVKRKVVAPQILLESQNQLKQDIAKWEAQEATVAKAEADLLSKEATLEEAIVDVDVARARVQVAESEEKRLKAWVGYFKLLAPYDGIIVARNANTWDFVLPSTGDPTAMMRAPDLSPGEKAAPVYVIDRTDIVRIYVDIPERDANFVHIGSPARVKIWAYKDEWIQTSVTRLAWALNTRSRTMRTEIDLPNINSQILPGMYAYGKVIIDRPDALTLPRSALTYSGGKAFFWRYEKGKAHRVEIQTGLEEEKWVEVTNRKIKPESEEEEQWVPMSTSEPVLIGHKLSSLTEGREVKLETSAPPIEKNNYQTRDNAM